MENGTVNKDRRRSNWKTAVKAVCSVFLAFLAANALCFFYYRMPGWYERDGNATSAVWQPGTRIVQALEGAGNHTVDGNGYVNPQKPLEKSGYILVLGSSHTMGENVSMEEKYTTLLDRMLYGDSDRLHVYNMAQHGHYFPELSAGFAAAVAEFPDSSAIVLELTDTEFTPAELEEGLKDRLFDGKTLGSRIVVTAGAGKEAQTAVKKLFPLFSFLAGKQFAGFRLHFGDAFGMGGKPETDAPGSAAPSGMSRDGAFEDTLFLEVLDKIVGKMRSRYDGRIIFLYHPQVELLPDGTMEIYREKKSWEVFRQVCGKYQVEWIDVGDRFLEGYRERWEVPYGFSNTEPGKGHLNRYGHRAMAEALYDAIEGGGKP